MLKLVRDMKPFDTVSVVEAGKVYQSRGKAEDAANASAIEDHLADLRAQRTVIVDKVMAEYKTRMPERFAAAAVSPPVEATAAVAPAKAAPSPKAATGKPLYASRPVLNSDAIIAWAQSQGFETTLPAADMHVTVAYSTVPIDGATVPKADASVVVLGGKRGVEPLGDKGAVVLKFASKPMQARWQQYRDAGASWDYEGYTPHITLTYDGKGVDLAKVEPYRGAIKLGPETQEALNEDKADEYVEKPTVVDETKASAAEAKPASRETAAKIGDSGEELKANRRNQAPGGLQWSDVEGLNPTLRVAEVTKEKVWPRPDYAAMVEAGTHPFAAHIVKQVYDKIGTAPDVKSTPTDADLQRYIAVVNRVRAAMEGWAANKGAQARMIEGIAGLGKAATSYGSQIELSKLMAAGEKPLLDQVFPGDDRRRFRNDAEAAKDARIAGGNPLIHALQPGYEEARRALKAVGEGWPAKQEAWQRSFEVRQTELRADDVPGAEPGSGPQKRWAVYEKGSKYRLAKNHPDGGFATQDEAVTWARDQVKRGRTTDEPDAKPLELAERLGEARRAAEENITSDRLRETFGFRGVNFGNWMPQDERQAHLNHAYDALLDLAALLNVPSKALSLNGGLGVAFGAQGKGGAAAHFVPGLNEINLTRTAGVGALAHEWGHAVDHYFGTQDGERVARAARPYMSAVAQPGVKAEGARQEIVDAFASLVKAMRKTVETRTAYAERIAKMQERAVRNLNGWLANARQTLDGKPEAHAKFDAVAEQLRTGDLGDGWVQIGFGKDKAIKPTTAALRELVREHTGRLLPVDTALAIDGWAHSVELYRDREKFMADHQPQEVATEFDKASGYRDAKKAKPYWQTPWEMFARAFETYVIDRLARDNARNDYLSDADRWARHEAAGLLNGPNPYPKGAEREAINAAFDRLVGALKTRETDAGVALFKRGTQPQEGAPQNSTVAGLSLSSARAEVDRLTADWENAPPITVLATPADAPFDAPDDANGAVYRGQIYLFASNLRSAAELQFTLFHEALGHTGLRGLLGAGMDAELRRIALLNAGLRKAAATWSERFGRDAIRQRLESGMTRVEARAAVNLLAIEEALADMAGSGKTITGLQRFMAKVQELLRAIGFDQVANWLESATDAEVASLLAKARKWVEGEQHVSTGAEVAAAFSQAEAPTLSRGTVAQTLDTLRSDATQRGVRETLTSLLDSDEKFNVWNRTVGTQFHKATKDKDFARVFNAVNDQLNDTSRYAIEAETEAPDILQRLGGFKDVAKAFMQGAGKHQVDMKVASKAIFANIEGQKGIKQHVFTDKELRDDFDLTDRQIELYREFRAAVDTSLDRLGQSLAMRLASEYVGVSEFKNQSLDDTVDAVQSMLDMQIEAMENQAEEFRAGHRGRREIVRSLQTGTDGQTRQEFVIPETDPALANELQKHIDSIKLARDKIAELRDFTRELQTRGYSPAMRFGRFAVSMGPTTDPDFFSLYETQVEANFAAMQLRRSNPGAQIVKSVINDEQWKMFAGVSPETVDLFARFMGVDQEQAFKDYVALAASTRSAMKRMLERKGVAGFSWDATRVLAQFVTSNARQAAMNVSSKAINQALHAIPREKGDVAQEAQRLVEYVRNPKEEAAGLRALLFAHFMGGSLASAAVNMTQPFMMTAPYLSQFVNAKTLAGIMARAIRAAAGGKIADVGVRAALTRAAADGITQPHEIHQLMAESQGSAFGKSVRGRAFAKAWGGFFSISESFNRRLTFIAAYEAGRTAGNPDPYQFAVNAVVETQGLYSKANRPNWARGPVGATLFTFKQFSIAYLEFLTRLPPKQKLIALAMLLIAAGMEGLPFAEDIEDLIDTLGQRMGYATNSKKTLRKAVSAILGDGMTEFALHGMSALPGFPIDVAGRMGMANLIPGTRLLDPSKTDKGNEVLETFGAVGGLAKSLMTAADSGKITDTVPIAVRNAFKGVEMATTGEYRDTRGRLVRQVGPGDAAAKAIGFQPAEVAADSRRIGEQMRDVAIVKTVESEIASLWARGIQEKNAELITEATDRLKKWNADNPDMPIAISGGQVARRVKEAMLTRDQRFMKTAPPELRRRMLAESVQ